MEGKTDLSEGRVPPQKLIEIMQISKFARVHAANPTRRTFDKFLVRHGVSPTTQISYTYEYRMPQSKTKFTCASPKKKMLPSETWETIIAGLVLCLIKNVSDYIFLPTFHFSFMIKLAIFIYIPPIFPALMPLPQLL